MPHIQNKMVKGFNYNSKFFLNQVHFYYTINWQSFLHSLLVALYFVPRLKLMLGHYLCYKVGHNSQYFSAPGMHLEGLGALIALINMRNIFAVGRNLE